MWPAFLFWGAEYGNRTRLPGLGSPCTTDVLIPRILNPNLLGADTRTRTGDLRITNALLYQLSHIGNLNGSLLFKSTPAGARTLDTLIKSQVLYQLSYGCMLFFKKKGGPLASLFVHPQGLEPWTP